MLSARIQNRIKNFENEFQRPMNLYRAAPEAVLKYLGLDEAVEKDIVFLENCLKRLKDCDTPLKEAVLNNSAFDTRIGVLRPRMEAICEKLGAPIMSTDPDVYSNPQIIDFNVKLVKGLLNYSKDFVDGKVTHEGYPITAWLGDVYSKDNVEPMIRELSGTFSSYQRKADDFGDVVSAFKSLSACIVSLRDVAIRRSFKVLNYLDAEGLRKDKKEFIDTCKQNANGALCRMLDSNVSHEELKKILEPFEKFKLPTKFSTPMEHYFTYQEYSMAKAEVDKQLHTAVVLECGDAVNELLKPYRELIDHVNTVQQPWLMALREGWFTCGSVRRSSDVSQLRLYEIVATLEKAIDVASQLSKIK